MKRGSLSVVAIALALAACMGPRKPVPEGAAVAPPAAWRTDPDMAGIDVTPEWWRALGDPTLERLVTEALAHNTDLGIAAARVDEADAQFRLARGDQLPSVTADGMGIGRRRTYSTLTGRGVEFSAYQAQLAVSFDADLFGKLRNRTAAARAQLLATQAAGDAVRIAVVAGVVSRYVGLRTIDASIAVLSDTLDSRRKQLALVDHQVREGYADAITVSQAAAAVHQVEQQLADAQLQQRQGEDALSVLLGSNPRAIERGRTLTDLPLLNAPTMLPSALLRRRPDIAEAEQQIVAADRSLSSARAAFLPNLTLNGTLGHLNADVLPAALDIWSIGGSILAPIFQGGKLRAQADIATAKRDQAAFNYRGTVLQALSEVEDALVALRQKAAKERAAAATEAEQAKTLRASEHRFAQGRSSYLEVLDAERGLLSARQALVTARSDRLMATVQLYQALGGGWRRPDEWPAAPTPRARAAPTPLHD